LTRRLRRLSRIRPARRGRTTLLIAGAALLGVVAGTCAGYLIQADREPTKLPSLSQPTLAQAKGKAPEPLSAARDCQVKADGDLRTLLLKKPGGAKAADSLAGDDGWPATKDFLAEYARKDARDELRQTFVDNGLRHIAARGWTTPDGTHTRVYLLQFGTAAVVDELFSKDIAPATGPSKELRGAGTSVFDGDFPPEAHDHSIPYSVYVESKPYGAEQVRQGYLSAGDVLAVIVQSRKGTAKAVPFRQTVALQSQLLG